MILPDSNSRHGRGSHLQGIGVLGRGVGTKFRRYAGGVCVALAAITAVEARGQNLTPTTLPSTSTSTSTAPDHSSSASGESATKFKKMTLDELMNVEVTTVTRGEGSAWDSAAAVAVITQDDISRTASMNIPDALRMVPGMEVAQINNYTWAISARGFNNNTADKLLVLMDGRSVYTPLYSGVYWDAQNTMMQDIDRIEVIRGPAGALWGANAVNGVVNIITKDAQDTQGLLVSGGVGNEERNFENARYGWQVNDNTYARVYATHFELAQTDLPNGSGADDAWYMEQSGFRLDSMPSPDDHLTVQGDIYQSFESSLNSDNTSASGGNIMGRWSQKFGDYGDIQIQAYYDRTNRDVPLLYKEGRDTFDVDFQHHIQLGKQNDLTWGLGYDLTTDHVTNGLIMFIPNDRLEQLFSFFVQDQIKLIPDELQLTLGTKVEHNIFTGFEVQPNARLLWTIDKHQNMWGAVSRAVRTPTQLEEDLTLIAPAASLIGDKFFQSEDVIAYELGYRVEPTDWLSFDLATYYNNYTNLRSLEFNGTIFEEENKLEGQTYGAELGATLKATDWWTFRGAFTFLHEQFQTAPGSTDMSSVATSGNDPQGQVYVRSSMDLSHNVQLDCDVRYVTALPDQQVPAYVAVDARVAWKPNENLELSLVAKNLCSSDHAEFGAPPDQNQIPRSVFGMFTYTW